MKFVKNAEINNTLACLDSNQGLQSTGGLLITTTKTLGNIKHEGGKHESPAGWSQV